MRVLQISSAKTYGGGERHFVDLCRGLQSRGHEVFAALRPTNNWQKKLDFFPESHIFHVSIRNSFGILSAKRIAGFIRENGIEIVHAHVARDYIPASIACSLAGNVKFVLTRHLLFPLKPFNKFALKNLSRAVAVSPGVEKALMRVFPAQKIVVIPNGIEAAGAIGEDRLKARQEFRSLHSISPGVPVIGIVGELIELKGQRDFVLAANEVAKRFPNAYFVVVGKDNTVDQKFRRELKRLVRVFLLEEKFLWLDWIDDTSELFAAIDILVSASHTESFGMAILEAMTCGAVVVATETEGGKELIRDKELLVPIGDPVALAKKICDILADPQRAESLANKAREYACTNFSLEKMIGETEALYRSLLH